MRCPACGAHNADQADWCTQCFASLRPPPPAVPPPGAPGQPAEPVAMPDPTPTPEAAARPGPASRPEADRDVRVRGDLVEWRCATCDAWSLLERSDCQVCGAPRHGFGEPVPADRPEASRATVIGLSIVLPGAGHVVAGRMGTGIARAVLALVWTSGGLALLLGARDSDASPLPSAPLLLGAFALWLLTLLDARSLTRGGPELVTSRLLMALTGAVILASLLLLVAAVPR